MQRFTPAAKATRRRTGPLSSSTASSSSAKRYSSISSSLNLIALRSSSVNGPQSNRKRTPPGRFGLGRQEVDAHQPAALDAQAALLQGLSLTGLPRRFSAGFDLTTGDGPALLVVRLQDEQPPRGVEDQGTGRSRDPGDGDRKVGHRYSMSDNRRGDSADRWRLSSGGYEARRCRKRSLSDPS